MLDQNSISSIAKGWKSPIRINWKVVQQEELVEFSKKVENAILYVLKEVLGISNFQHRVDVTKIVLLDKETFGQLGVVLWDQKEKDVIADIVKQHFSPTTIAEKYNKYKPKGVTDYCKTSCKEFYSTDLGTACEGFQIINKDMAMPELGLHLLCHEILHTLANPQTVLSLRKVKANGDEATNEFIARIVSFYAELGGTTTEDMGRSSSTDELNNNHGVYGGLLDQEGFAIKTPEEITKIVNDYLIF